jgi:zinc resistance-associated protein
LAAEDNFLGDAAMLKRILIATTALTIAGSGLVLAQQAAPQETQRQQQQETRRGMSPEDRAALTDARIAGLKAGLKLTPEQEKNWPAVETAIRDLAKQRADQTAARRNARASTDTEQRRPDAIERLRRDADAMSTRAAGLKRLADAAQPLYQSLDDGQKRRFTMLLRVGSRPDAGRHGSRRNNR